MRWALGWGIMAQTLLAALGVSALLTASETAFWVMKLVGGAYLIYLGVQQWRSVTSTTLLNAPKAPLTVIFWRGMLSNLLNPKVALFVLAFVPQFVRAGDGVNPTSSPLLQMLLLGAIFSILTVIAYGALGAAAGGVSRWLAAHPAYLRGVNRGSAGLFVASGAAVLLLDRRR